MAATFRYLSAADVAALLPPPAEVLAFCEQVLHRLGSGESCAAINGGVQWSSGYDAGRHAALKSAAGAVTGSAARSGAASGAPTLGALLAPDGGQPLVVLDAGALSIARDAACTALTARLFADPKAHVVALLGCNPRGRAVMASIVAALPRTERMLCFDPDIPAQNELADHIMTNYDVASVVPPEPRECTEGAHIVVSCLRPALPAPVIERDWLQTGTVCIALDVDNTFTPAALAAADRRLTDDLVGWRACAAQGHFPGVPEPDSELAAIVAGKAPGRPPGKPIIAAALLGLPPLDAALAAELLRRAQAANRGAVLAV